MLVTQCFIRLKHPLSPPAFINTLTLRSSFHQSPSFHKKSTPLPPKPTVAESDITETFLKGSGPGGQKINKTSSAVQLKHLPTGLVVKSQETRSRSQNRKIARKVLAEKLDWLENGKESREWIKGEKERLRKERARRRGKRKYGRKDEDTGGEPEKVGHGTRDDEVLAGRGKSDEDRA